MQPYRKACFLKTLCLLRSYSKKGLLHFLNPKCLEITMNLENKKLINNQLHIFSWSRTYMLLSWLNLVILNIMFKNSFKKITEVVAIEFLRFTVFPMFSERRGSSLANPIRTLEGQNSQLATLLPTDKLVSALTSHWHLKAGQLQALQRLTT